MKKLKDSQISIKESLTAHRMKELNKVYNEQLYMARFSSRKMEVSKQIHFMVKLSKRQG